MIALYQFFLLTETQPVESKGGLLTRAVDDLIPQCHFVAAAVEQGKLQHVFRGGKRLVVGEEERAGTFALGETARCLQQILNSFPCGRDSQNLESGEGILDGFLPPGFVVRQQFSIKRRLLEVVAFDGHRRPISFQKEPTSASLGFQSKHSIWHNPDGGCDPQVADGDAPFETLGGNGLVMDYFDMPASAGQFERDHHICDGQGVFHKEAGDAAVPRSPVEFSMWNSVLAFEQLHSLIPETVNHRLRPSVVVVDLRTWTIQIAVVKK
jgi:hypothetical protein